MKLIAIAIVSFLATAAFAQQKCQGVYFHGRQYNVEILKDGVNKIHDMVLNHNDNTLYFTFDQIARVPTRVLGYLNLDTRQSGLIEGIRNATSVTINQEYDIVYIAGSEGIYKLNAQKVPEILPIRDVIKDVYFKDVLYFVNGRDQAFLYQSGFVNRVFELQGVSVDKLVLGDDSVLFFTQGKTLFRVKVGTRAVNTLEKYKANFITADNFDRLYVSTDDGVYVYNKYKYVLDRVSNMNNLRALTFDRNNEPIFVVHDLIMKLTSNTTKCVEI